MCVIWWSTLQRFNETDTNACIKLKSACASSDACGMHTQLILFWFPSLFSSQCYAATLPGCPHVRQKCYKAFPSGAERGEKSLNGREQSTWWPCVTVQNGEAQLHNHCQEEELQTTYVLFAYICTPQHCGKVCNPPENIATYYDTTCVTLLDGMR